MSDRLGRNHCHFCEERESEHTVACGSSENSRHEIKEHPRLPNTLTEAKATAERA